MRHYHRIHLLHYALICSMILTGGLALILLPSGFIRVGIIGGLALLYLIWGIWHHYSEHSLSQQVILEYLSVVAIVTTVLLLVS